jgi:hypothetical protein
MLQNYQFFFGQPKAFCYAADFAYPKSTTTNPVLGGNGGARSTPSRKKNAQCTTNGEYVSHQKGQRTREPERNEEKEAQRQQQQKKSFFCRILWH